jgi:transposase
MDVTPEMRQWHQQGMSLSAIAQKLGRSKSTIIEAFGRERKGEPAVPTKNAKPVLVAPAARTLADFRRDHDQAWKIRDGLKRLFGGGVIMTDAEFREAVNGNPSRWRAAADQSEFKAHRYRVGGELLWASADTIAEMRRIRGEAV